MEEALDLSFDRLLIMMMMMLEERLDFLYVPSVENITKSLSYKKARKQHEDKKCRKMLQQKCFRQFVYKNVVLSLWIL